MSKKSVELREEDEKNEHYLPFTELFLYRRNAKH